MYNKKIAPRIPCAIRGAIWCQGEHNSSDGRIYVELVAQQLPAGCRNGRLDRSSEQRPGACLRARCGTRQTDRVAGATHLDMQD